MKLATWNVNSLKVRLPQLLGLLAREQPDVMCLQETKTEDANFPVLELRQAGYEALFAGQKTYNGVAILSRSAGSNPLHALPEFVDPQKRVLAASVDGIRVICVYVPNGESVESEKYRYKLAWLDGLRIWLAQEVQQHRRLAVLGDYNIAPQDRDVHDPKLWQGKVLFTEPERASFRALLDLGLADSFRLLEQPERSFSWWDYRMNAFKRNLGLRIDHILVTDELAGIVKASRIDKSMRALERPSDHAPVITELQ